MKQALLIATFFLTMATLCCCEKNTPMHSIELSPAFQKEVTFEAKGGTWNFNFSSSADWHIECQDEWVTATPNSGGAGVHTFSLVADPEPYGEERHTMVSIIAQNERHNIVVHQRMREILSFDQDDNIEIHKIGNEGSTLKIDLTTNVEYEVKMPQGSNFSWVKLAETRAVHSETLTLHIEPNATPMTRVAAVEVLYIIHDEEQSHTITIVQQASGEPQNEIVYSTTQNEAIVLDTSADFGATFAVHFFDDDVDKGRIIFHENVRKIPDSCFANQLNITQIDIPNSIEHIGARAFAGCCSINEITLPTSLRHIDEAVFEGCTFTNIICYNIPDQPFNKKGWLECSNISRVTLRGNVGMNAFSGYTPLTTIIMDGAKRFGSGAFKGCSNIEIVATPSQRYWYEMSIYDGGANPLTNSDAVLVANGKEITTIEVPEGITKVKGYLFTNYQHITNITINDSVTSVGAECFARCNVDNIYLGSGINTVGQKFLDECHAEGVTINFNIPNLQHDASSLSHWLHGLITPVVIFGDSVTSIGDFALSALNARLTTIIIGDNVTRIGQGAFANCSSVQSIVFGESVTKLDKHALFNCSGLKDITIPQHVTHIGDYAFDGCSQITSFKIPSEVTFIGEYAFNNCSSLQNVVCYPTQPPTLGNIYTFGNTATLHVPEEAIASYLVANNWRELQHRIEAIK